MNTMVVHTIVLGGIDTTTTMIDTIMTTTMITTTGMAIIGKM